MLWEASIEPGEMPTLICYQTARLIESGKMHRGCYGARYTSATAGRRRYIVFATKPERAGCPFY